MEMSTRFLWVGRPAEEEASSPIPLETTCKLTPTQQLRRIARAGDIETNSGLGGSWE